jgi:hypothetical protein
MTDHGGDDAPTRICTACGSVVPAARFCGECGAESDRPVNRWSVLLRPRVYATAHRETLWLPRLSSTLFPRFPGEIRKPLQAGVTLVTVAIVVLSLLRMNGPLAVIATLGWPLMGTIYIWQSDVFRDIPLRIYAIATALGIAFGVGWWLTAGKMLAASYGVSTATSLQVIAVINSIVLLNLGGAALMVLPAFVARLVRMPVRESLDGFIVGAVGALWYSIAATTTIQAPQFAEGLIEEHSAGRMFQDWATNGIVVPIVATAAGGLVGLSLWFQPRRGAKHARGSLAIATVLAVFLYVAVWLVDAQAPPPPVDIATKLVLAVCALLTIRVAIQIALLHEVPDPASGQPLLCVHCDKVVPDLPFCSSCGAAARASSRTSRRLRHEYPPVRELATG